MNSVIFFTKVFSDEKNTGAECLETDEDATQESEEVEPSPTLPPTYAQRPVSTKNEKDASETVISAHIS